MTDKKSLNGKKFEGVLAEPIDTGLFMPILANDPAWPKYLEAHRLLLDSKRREKIVDLARHLDIDVEAFNLSDPSNGIGLLMLYSRVAIELASHVVPGFQEKSRGKQPREIVRAIRIAVDLAKKNPKGKKSEFELCRDYLKGEMPDLARPGKRTELDKKARSLANRISNDRVAAKREEKALHKKPPLRVVK
jgi:hypothetical protein